MSVDFQVVFPQTLVPLSNVTYLPGIQPRTLDVIGEDFTAIDEVRVDLDPTERVRMVEITGRRTVPQIFIGETHVGGCDDLHALESAGKLDPMLA